ncbi:MAG: ferredoxin--NADP reductase [Prolixibacteraceae bacterium]
MARKKTPDNRHKLNKVTLTANNEISPGVHLISFRRTFDFLPGQVVKIGTNDKNPPRIYSICSGKKDEEIQILFNIKKGGVLTPRLSRMIPGEEIWVSEPYGSFLGDDQPAWWIAAGTGIAPFYSMFKSEMAENKKLIHGVRFLNQFYFEDEWKWKLGQNYIQCCSKEYSSDVFPGRVTKYLSGITIFPDIKYYICGSALMVVEVRDLLISKGVNFNSILSEIYF